MSDDRVVPFAHRIGDQVRPALVGNVTFSNRALKLRSSPFPTPGPEWTIWQGRAVMEGRDEPLPFHVNLGCIDFAEEPDAGWLSENEHGLSGVLNFDAPYFNLLQLAALSAADLELGILFATDDGDVRVLSLSIEHKTA